MSSGNPSPEPGQWEYLYKAALFEADVYRMPERIEAAKHAILDRLEDASQDKRSFRSGEVVALGNAHRALKVLEQLYCPDVERKKQT